MPTVCRSWRRVGKAEVNMGGSGCRGGGGAAGGRGGEEEEEEENNCDKIQQPSPGRWGKNNHKIPHIEIAKKT